MPEAVNPGAAGPSQGGGRPIGGQRSGGAASVGAVDLAVAFRMAPEDAVRYFTSKGYAITWDWHELWQAAHARAFTVAGVLSVDALQTVRASLERALRQGKSLAAWKQDLRPALEAAGLLGRHKLINPDTGEAKTLAPWRLNTIYRTNVQSAFQAGRWARFQREAERAPYVQYLAVMDSRTRPSHAALNGKVFRLDDPALQVISPPNGFNCRCRLRNLDARELEQRGLQVETDAQIAETEVPLRRPLPGEAEPPRAVRRGVSVPDRNDPNGRKRVGMWADLGWDYNPGASWTKPFTPPPLEDPPRTFPQGVALPELPTPTRVDAARILPDGLAPEDYAAAFLTEFGASLDKPVVFEDVKGAELPMSVDLFRDGAGEWKATKNGRGPYMRLLADAVKAPDEIWLRWEASRDTPGAWLLKRRYIKTFEIGGEAGTDTQYGLSVFEFGKDGWSGSTSMVAKPDRSPAARRRYIEQQRDGFLLYRA